MNNLITNFEQILSFAQGYNLPMHKKRAILREYLQAKILELIYREKLSKNLFFVGGTSLRILHAASRFSEDLDFDFEKLELKQLDGLMQGLADKLTRENFALDFVKKVSGKRRYYDLRFKDILYQLDISQQDGEKLRIKFDFENIWQGHKRELILLDRYGFLANVVSIPLDQLLVQKLTAYTGRKQTQPRDIYDIVWLVAQGAKIDWEFAKANKINASLTEKAQKKFIAEESKLAGYKRRLKPFLLAEDDVNKLDFFSQMLEKLEKLDGS